MLLCFKCGDEEFDNRNALGNHVRYCKGCKDHDFLNPANYYHHDSSEHHKKRMMERMEYTIHDNGSEPLSFLRKKHRVDPNPADDSDSDDSQLDLFHNDSSQYDTLFEGISYTENVDVEQHSYQGVNSVYHPTRMPTKFSEDPYIVDTSQCGIPLAYRFQIDLADLFANRRVPLALYDDVINLMKSYSNSRGQLNFSTDTLKDRAGLLSRLEKIFQSSPLEPEEVDVTLSNGAEATVSVFDIEAMILSLLKDDELMKEENLVPGYDLHSGKPTSPSDHYGEVHTGDAWEPARSYYCGDYSQNMPLALILFVDKSHFDLHGSLATAPMIFTLNIFNERARNDVRFWRPISYIPNLDFDKISTSEEDNLTDHEKSRASLQDEHNCIAASLKSLVRIVRQGGIATMVKGKSVILKVWIHYVIGDTSGNNRLVGQYNNSGKSTCPYRDCFCNYPDMDETNPQCVYVRLVDYEQKKKECDEATSKTAKQKVDKSWSKHNIDNAFMDDNIPLSDLIHGIYRMVPPELLHTTQEGITEYILAVLRDLIGTDKVGSDTRQIIERLHQRLHNDRKRNSERDFPRSAARTGLLKDTLVNASERRGNLFLLLCLSHTDGVQNWLFPLLEQNGVDPLEYLKCLKMYLAMEEWFHETNPKDEVKAARTLISQVLEMVKNVFQREQGHGWKLQKMHGLTKMQYYMTLFGSGINFFGGPGESNHKKFVKDMGTNTQCRVDSFSSQVARRYYETMLYEIAKNALDKKIDSEYELMGKKADEEGFTYTTEGEYKLTINNISLSGTSLSHTAKWKNNDRSKGNIRLNQRFVDAVTSFAYCADWHGPLPLIVAGYTSCTILLGGQLNIYRAVEDYGGDGKWYDWCLFDEFDENDVYVTKPACILGIFKYKSNVIPSDDPDQTYVVLQAAQTLMPKEKMEAEFISKFEMSEDVNGSTRVVPLEYISSPLFVYKNYGGSSREYFCALPKRKWGRYFGDKVQV